MAFIEASDDDDDGEAAQEVLRFEERITKGVADSYEATRWGFSTTLSGDPERFNEDANRTKELAGIPADETDKTRPHAIVRPAFFTSQGVDGKGSFGAIAGALLTRKDGSYKLIHVRGTHSLHEIERYVNAKGEVMKKTKVKEHHVLDLAVLYYLGLEAGINIQKAGIDFFDAKRTFDETVVDPALPFAFLDFTDKVKEMKEKALDRIGKLRYRFKKEQEALLNPQPEPPPLPRTHISLLYRKGKLVEKFEAQGITDLREIPDDIAARDPSIKLTPNHWRQIRSLREDRMIVDDVEGLRSKLQHILDLGYEPDSRISFFDFETIRPNLALIRGSKNGEMITVQLSNHAVAMDGTVTHTEYLYNHDPLAPNALALLDQELADTILRSVGRSGAIVVYNEKFERARIRELAIRLRERGDEKRADALERILPDGNLRDLARTLETEGEETLARQLNAVIGSDSLVKEYREYLDKASAKKNASPRMATLAQEMDVALSRDRFVDLWPIIEDHIYHPDFNSSLSLKSVLKVLCPGKGYDDLIGVKNGGMATKALEEILNPATSPERREDLRRQLFTYCHRDTEAEVWLLDALMELAGMPSLKLSEKIAKRKAAMGTPSSGGGIDVAGGVQEVARSPSSSTVTNALRQFTSTPVGFPTSKIGNMFSSYTNPSLQRSSRYSLRHRQNHFRQNPRHLHTAAQRRSYFSQQRPMVPSYFGFGNSLLTSPSFMRVLR